MINIIMFYFFAAVLVAGAIVVITARNSVKSALALILCFVACSGLWILIHAEFLALILILVYVGAVMVLFLFVVMMLNIELSQVKEGFTKYFPVALLVAILVALQLIYVVKASLLGYHINLLPRTADYNNTAQLGYQLYTKYALTFEIAAVLLLVAMISAVTLTYRGTTTRRTQSVSKQVKVNKATRLQVIKSADAKLI